MFYNKHIFFCTNKKQNGAGCATLGAEAAFSFAKMYMQSLNIWGEGKNRASKSGCLGRCESGPVCVVYPDGIWYTYVDEIDIQEIIDVHINFGNIVERLKLASPDV